MKETEVLKNIDVVQILSYGVIGLGFLLALLAYRLLTQEQKRNDPRQPILWSIYVFMFFSAVLCVIGVLGQFVDGRTKPTPIPIFDFNDYLARKRVALEHGDTPEQFQRGELEELKETTLELNLPAGATKSFLAVVKPGNECEISWYANGEGATDVVVNISGDPDCKVGTISTSDTKPAQVGLTLRMVRGSGSYSLETFFQSQMVPKDSIDDATIDSSEKQLPMNGVVVDFSSVDTSKAPGLAVPAAPRLHDFGISVAELSPPGSELLIKNNRALYGGEGVNPTDSQNILEQENAGQSPVAYTLHFSKPCYSVTFTVPAFFAETDSGVTHPAWNALAFDSASNELSSHSESLLRSFTNVPPETVTLRAPAFTGITSVRFESDYRLNGKPFAAFASILIERLSYVPMNNSNQ